MAYGDTEDAPLVPGTTPQPDVQGAAQTGGLADNWRSWMSDPHNRAAMIQFGLALSQPVSAGQNALGHIGQAAGQAGEASDRITAEEDKQTELASKQELRTAQGEASTQRAGAAEARAGTARTAAEAAQQRLLAMQDRTQLTGLINLQKQYNAVIKDIAHSNALGLSGKQEPIPTFEEWLAKNPQLSEQVSRGGGSTYVAPGTGKPPTKVNSPEEAQGLPVGTRYATPDGRVFTR